MTHLSSWSPESEGNGRGGGGRGDGGGGQRCRGVAAGRGGEVRPQGTGVDEEIVKDTRKLQGSCIQRLAKG